MNNILSQFSTKDLVIKFENFITNKKSNVSAIEESLKSYLSRAYKELDWYNNYSPQIFEWLDKTYPNSDYRLTKNIYPTSYKIYLTPYFDNFTFDGRVEINVNVMQNTSSIVLHANKLTIKKINVSENSLEGNSLTVSSYFINPKTHKFTIYLSTTVSDGSNLTVNIEYTGILNNKMEGFYRSYYKDDYGSTQ